MRTQKILLCVFAFVLLLAGGVGAYFIFRCDHQWQEATCESPSVCVLCGATQNEALGHQWNDATCVTARQCSRCSALEGEALGHECFQATCTEDARCSRCGEIQEKALGHDWQEATCLVPKTCLRCKQAEGELARHRWQEATCIAPKTCTVCQAVEEEALGHDWQEATCLVPKTCLRCENTEGELARHRWQEATCIAPEACSVCGTTKGELGDHRYDQATCTAPETCRYCKATRGEALGHSWREATCTRANSCSRCGKSEGEPLGHQYEDTADPASRTCSRCHQTVGRKYVAITFDDGPSGNVTASLLEGLKERGVKATFFLCGYRIRSYPSLPQAIHNDGHEIGLHTVNHATLTKLEKEGIRRELEGMLSALPEERKITLMRPPGGAYNTAVKEVCAELGLSVIMWSVDPKDWATGNSAAIVSGVVSGTYDGSIILMHDLRSSSVRAALEAIDRLKAQGYEFVTVSELAKIKGYDLEEGQVYHSFR